MPQRDLWRAPSLFATRRLGDPGGDLPDFDVVRAENRRLLIKLAERAVPLLRVVASRTIPAAWAGGASEIIRHIENAGLLDFRTLTEREIIDVLDRTGLWPSGIPKTLDLCSHGLTPQDLDQEKRREQERAAEEALRHNRVDFAGKEFDAGAPDFKANFGETARAAFEGIDLRSRGVKGVAPLLPQQAQARGHISGSGQRREWKASAKASEPVRSAIGLSGEIAAYWWLKAKHRQRFSDACWVSENRISMFAEPGNASLGYDFRVMTSRHEWLYEVKATAADACEFELTDNEYRTAIAAEHDSSKRYRILFVRFALDPESAVVLELPNPAAEECKNLFRIVSRSAVRMAFELPLQGG